MPYNCFTFKHGLFLSDKLSFFEKQPITDHLKVFFLQKMDIIPLMLNNLFFILLISCSLTKSVQLLQ